MGGREIQRERGERVTMNERERGEEIQRERYNEREGEGERYRERYSTRERERGGRERDTMREREGGRETARGGGGQSDRQTDRSTNDIRYAILSL